MECMGPVLPRDFYARDPATVARDLLGKILVHGATAGRIVEAEAYLGEGDLAAHSARGITPRTRVLFGPPGHAYVYLIYGMYECLNLVCEREGAAGCVLLRALEPCAGLELMRQRRPAARRAEDLCSGPGRLTMALGISRTLNGRDVTIGGDLVVRRPARDDAFEITISPRIGISLCRDLPLRFAISGNRFVSRAPKV